jgi:16S rRNA G1207 methylase RsmC
MRLLGGAARAEDPAGVLLVHCGEVPGIGPGATRLILDVRERGGSAHRCVPELPSADADTPGRFACALVWPRAHLGKDFSELCLAQAALAVRRGGRVLCAARKQKGGKSLAKTLEKLLGGVEVVARDRGYHLYEARRGDTMDQALARELLERSYLIEDPCLGPRLPLRGVPGVFSRKELDAGTRALIEVVDAMADANNSGGPLAPESILDLCAGVGPLALWSALRWPGSRVLAVESNLRACACLRANIERADLGDRVRVAESDGLPGEGFEDLRGRCELALVNPPTHADRESLSKLLSPLPRWLGPGGRALLVVNRPGLVVEVLKDCGAQLSGGERDGYLILSAQW